MNMGVYRRLVKNSIELQKIKQNIPKLKEVIRNLQKKVRLYERDEKKSSVNIFIHSQYMEYLKNSKIFFNCPSY